MIEPEPSPYPRTPSGRDRWILERRSPRARWDPGRPQGCFAEGERAASGAVVPVATVFLTNRECPWRCLMCDLWKTTLADTVPHGAIPAQIESALETLPPCRQLKLYNSGSFFDPRAIPPGDHPAIAALGRRFERVIVECHPALVGEACLSFRDRLAAPWAGALPGGTQLEVAMGLETAHPGALEKLNKRMTLDHFARAARFLKEHHIALRAFVLVQPPFQPVTEAVAWAVRSAAFAFDCGATVVSLIPTRPGNGALETLAACGDFVPPKLGTLEAAAAQGIGLRRERVFADVWDLEPFSTCPACLPRRVERLRRMNLEQAVAPPVACPQCDPP